MNKRLSTKYSEKTPISELLWNAKALSDEKVNRKTEEIKIILQENNIYLNEVQWEAWEKALTSRLQLIWGPPGTGKSKTARSIIIGAFLDAYMNGTAGYKEFLTQIGIRYLGILHHFLYDLVV